MASAPTEFRAKRTHARRSCDLCKLRKTRCELPDLDIIASPDPQPLDKSCHRCQVLSLPCVVDDSKSGAKGKRRETGESTASNGGGRGSSPKRRKPARASNAASANGHAGAGIGEKTLASIVNDSLELMQSFEHAVDPSLRRPSATSTPTGFGVIPGDRSSDFHEERERSMRYHGRPLELVSAMLTVAYGRTRTLMPRTAFAGELDLALLVDEGMRQRLEPGYNKLRAYHPHLEPMSNLFVTPADDLGPSRPLLVALALYLSTLGLPASAGQRLRESLTPYIYALRDSVLLHMPANFATLQALELFALHAPLGVLPFDTTSLSSLAPGRGVIQTASAIASELNVSLMIRTMSRMGQVHLWLSTDTWTWLSSCVAEANSKLEDQVARPPASLADARTIAEGLWEGEDLDVWRKGATLVDEADFLGRLYVCDRLLRVAEVLDSVGRSRGILETVSKEPNFDVTDAIDAELKFVVSRLEALDAKHQAIYDLLPVKTEVSNGWMSYRQVRRRYETIKSYEVGMRCLLAAQFVNDPATPAAHSAASKVNAAMGRAINPTEIMPLLVDGTKPYTFMLWHYGRARHDIAVEVVEYSADLLAGIMQPDTYLFAPVVETMCMAIESGKNLVESQAWKISVHRVHRPILHEARHPAWIATTRATAHAMSRLASFTPTATTKGHEPIANGCANIMASFTRLAVERSIALDNNPETAPSPPQQQGADPSGSGSAHPSDAGGNHMHHHGSLASHHDYMDTSDRWMADGLQQAPPPTTDGHNHHEQSAHAHQYDTSHPVNPSTGYPVMIDQILSEAFNYSSTSDPQPPVMPPQSAPPGYGPQDAMWPTHQQ